MFCVQCGQENPDSGLHCWSCGNKLFKRAGSPQPVTAAPTPEPATPAPAIAHAVQTAFRDRKKLIVPNSVLLPQLCVNCANVGTLHQYRFAWMNPNYFVLFFLGILPYFIARLFLRKTVKLLVPLCDQHFNRSHRLRVAALVTLVVSIPAGFVVNAAVGEIDGTLWGVVSTGLLVVSGLVFLWMSYPLRAVLIDRNASTFMGACEDFLKSLPSLKDQRVESNPQMAYPIAPQQERLQGIEKSQPPASIAAQAVDQNKSGVVAKAAYATLWQRFQAYFCDLVMVYLVVFGLYFLSGLLGVFGKGFLSGDESEAKGIGVIVLCCYMILSLTVYHTTIGKYILGIEVASDRESGAYPSFWRVLFRETVGRFVSSLFFGVGYWKVPGSLKNKAWSDDIAHTVVQRRTVNRTLKNALAAFVVIAFFTDIGLVTWGYQLQERKKNHDAWESQVASISSQVSKARQTANEIYARNPNNLREIQANMTEMLSALDNYDRLLERYRQSIQRADRENLFASDVERHQVRVLLEVLDLRKQQSAKQRQEANLVLAFNPYSSSASELQSTMRLMDSDISALDRRASDKLAEIGIR